MSAINNPVKESFYKKKLSYFKQYYTYFHTLFDPTSISKNFKQQFSNYFTKYTLNVLTVFFIIINFHTLFDQQVFQKTPNNNSQTTLPNITLIF